MTLSSLNRILTVFQQGLCHSNLCLDASYVFNALSGGQTVDCQGLSLQQYITLVRSGCILNYDWALLIRDVNR